MKKCLFCENLSRKMSPTRAMARNNAAKSSSMLEHPPRLSLSRGNLSDKLYAPIGEGISFWYKRSYQLTLLDRKRNNNLSALSFWHSLPLYPKPQSHQICTAFAAGRGSGYALS